MNDFAKNLPKHVESGLSSTSKEVMKIHDKLTAILTKSHMKPKLFILEDFNEAMNLVDQLNNMTAK